jgi:hypothetical protein
MYTRAASLHVTPFRQVSQRPATKIEVQTEVRLGYRVGRRRPQLTSRAGVGPE